MAKSFMAYNFPSRLKRSPIWCIYGLWMLFVGVGSLHGQKYSSLPENDRHRLRTTSHLLIDLKETNPDSLVFVVVDKNNPPWAVIPSQNQAKNTNFLNQYSNYGNQLVVLGQKGPIGQIPENLSLIWVADSDMVNVEFSSKMRMDSLIRSGNGELLNIHFDKGNAPSYGKLLDIWQHLGKIPNFISSEAPFEHLDSLVRALNTNPKIFGVVKTEKGLLDKVIFKGLGNAPVDGYFSYPVVDPLSLPILEPYRPGFHFSPDMIYASPENLDNTKEFVGFPLDAGYGLSHHFGFKDGVVDVLAKKPEGLISKNVNVKKDSLYGKVGYFEDGTYVDAGISSKSSLKGNFTISAWIKPTRLGQNNSIVGKGDGFVFKVHEGFLTFTMAGVKDYVSTSSPVPLNQWSHVALVHSKMGNVLFFYINGKRTDTVELVSGYETSNYNILIASNLWEEFFTGYIREVKIWERELDDSEIKGHYDRTKALDKDPYLPGYALLSLVLLGGVYGVFRYFFWGPKVVRTGRGSPLAKVSTGNGRHSSQILCFGPLQIIDGQGLDIAKKLSPLQKKMFMVIFLHSQEGGKGMDTKQLTDLLWPGRSVANAKNTRGTTIQNLRQSLGTCPSLELLFKDRHWVLEMGGHCYSDYSTVLRLLGFLADGNYSGKALVTELQKLMPIVKKGRLFANTSAPWMDPFIEKFSNRIVEQFIRVSKNPMIKSHTDIMLDLAEVICLYDDLNEHALKIKLNALIEQGKFSLAHQACHNFKRRYEKIYGLAYGVPFEDMISSR